MIKKQDRRLRVGVLGCGPIAQFAHLESCVKAGNADLYAICDAAPDLLARMGATYEPQKMYSDYEAMLADPELEAVIVATSDAYHVPMSIRALNAGKHVLCEKPIGTSVEEGEALAEAVRRSGKILQVGHMKRFDPALEAARDFVRDEIGEVLALKAWYCDSTHRYTNTDAVQPLPVTSRLARKPAGNPKADLRQYFMLAHGSHLVDTARFLCGDIVAVRARLNEKFGAYCWFVETEFASGALGHLDLTVAVRMDWHEGFQLYGENGSVIARTFNPWYFRASEVEIFHEKTATAHKPLGADGHFFRRQLEGLADTVLNGTPMRGANVEDGIASIRAMVAIARSVVSGERVELASVSGAV
ncbi:MULTISPECIES: Gfo/Idh/MocA family oxidoreductase [unclassified Mesorhizobium]|uniref:Gfo/Idh/MocA family protein n=1 Tax=unclassified Mesorhizobium TaxID=325217 RepID=UPI000FC99C6A|nr:MULTISPECIES: Gfo/Idh/MocA family oxidoreductase [unclassified Mesorhizobium]RUU62600.1 Gfo/Idh/MocA family oxidoreductase [Mesorhizobium sp. M7A.T.Ca.TU.009.01.1.1]RUU80022.1 Gfo/Idh/MocA family oxidoreductase [Mesorhizobium sp. M7A.T.Ca.TU.009.01.1.2]AZV23278.1 Gfo/Idh/MocA family oxidoreductase [Mesorhizobium sp. M7A.F.Ce.TU.012.03.2.1]RUT89570.1 Gfo/Idh/MocA family oxidoreductase [Mesorhizobium sp. M7A.T.Ca.US.000.02.1.1]RUT91522.1 Gfo/Idh/MocA family oxidoreductase [Mesorhizobium sp. M